MYEKIATNLQHNRQSMICLMLNMLTQAKLDSSHDGRCEPAGKNLLSSATHINVGESSHEDDRRTNYSHQCEVIIRPIFRLEYPLACNVNSTIGSTRRLDMWLRCFARAGTFPQPNKIVSMQKNVIKITSKAGPRLGTCPLDFCLLLE